MKYSNVYLYYRTYPGWSGKNLFENNKIDLLKVTWKSLEIEKDSTNYKVFFTSLEQNANRIPLQQINAIGDSINFKLQSDYYTYTFKNKWINNNTRLKGSLTVDTTTVNYSLEKELKNDQALKSEDIVYKSNNLKFVENFNLLFL